MIDNTTGIILAGGESVRMGKDKAFILFSGKPLIETVMVKLSALFKDLIIITNKPRLYRKYGIKIQKDILPGRGPLGGIYTGLLSSKTLHNFIVACDMPFLNQDLIRYMVEEINGFDVVIAKAHGRFQPVHAVYSKHCIGPIENELSKNNLKITNFFQYVKVRTITEKEAARFDPDGLSFKNINTPENIEA